MDLTGKTAVVTGASSGIGEATAKTLAGAGMQVVAVARRKDRLEQLAATTPGIRAYAADVTSDSEVGGLAAWVRDELGACHVLVNNAGAKVGGDHFRSAADRAGVEATMDVNFFGAVRMMGAFAELLFASVPARVVNVASVAGKVGVGPPSYVASKFALVGFTESVGRDWAKRGVTVSQVNPGFVVTEGIPQHDIAATPLRPLLVGPDVVATAILDVVRTGAVERTTPRWYRSAAVVRHAATPLWSAVSRRLPR